MSKRDDMFVEVCALQKKGDYTNALPILNKVLVEDPKFAPGWNNRGAMLQKLGFPFDAVMNYEKAIQCSPEAAEHYNNRGAAYIDLGKYEEAIADFDRAAVRNPRMAEIKNNKGNALMQLNRVEEAVDAYRSAISLRPDYNDGHLGLALSLLKAGRYEEGWKEFEWRWGHQDMVARNLPYPKWDGDKAENPDQGLLLYGEQGLGDDLQFMRYAALAKGKAWFGKVYLELRQPLVRIASTMDGIDGVIAFGEKPPANVVCVAPAMSVPGLIWPKYKEIPSTCPYIFADEYRVGLWRERLEALPPGPLIGLCWAGMNRDKSPAASSIDARRSMQLQQFRPLTMLKGISWVSLQMGPAAQQLTSPPTGMLCGDWTCDLYDFYDTAALIECLDLVITVDTSVAHVAGALGKPVWMLSRYDGCWRWLKQREDTQWYPTMRIFNQKEHGNWEEVIERMEVALRQFLTSIMEQRNAA